MSMQLHSYYDSTAARPRAGTARRRLHLLALLLSLATVAGGGLAFSVAGARNWLMLALAAVTAAQIAALCGWPLLWRSRSTFAALGAGLGMTLLMHLLIGPAIAAASVVLDQPIAGDAALDSLYAMLLVSVLVAAATIWVTLPAIVSAAVHVHGLLQRERGID